MTLRTYQRLKNKVKKNEDMATRDDFFGLLKRRYGTLIAAWRQYLDPMNNGKLSYRPFCHCCQELRQADGHVLWKNLVAHSRIPGFIDLSVIDSAIFEQLTDFAGAMFADARNLNDAWRWSLNKENAGVTFDTFQRYLFGRRLQRQCKIGVPRVRS